MRKITILTTAFVLFSANAFAISKTELQQQLKNQQKQMKILEKRLNIIADSVDEKKADSKLSLGGYGELHYNNGSEGSKVDLHRFVLGAKYDYTDRIRFISELELEHSVAGEEQEGEIKMEQAYLEFDFFKSSKLKTGLFLVPVGILNGIHEPNTFYGVERNPVEKNIIPTSWWEAGLLYQQKFQNGFSYDLAYHSGLNLSTSNDLEIRAARQKVSKAHARSGSHTIRIKYKNKNLELAATGSRQTDILQEVVGEQAEAYLYETHLIFNLGGFSLRALYAGWHIKNTVTKEQGTDDQYGYYIEPSYKFNLKGTNKLGFFVRYNEYDNKAGSEVSKSKIVEYGGGINYWPIDKIVFKADHFTTDFNSSKKNDTVFNLGIGFVF